MIRQRSLVLPSSAAALLACSCSTNPVTSFGAPRPKWCAEKPDVVLTAVAPRTDILFVIDDSSQMDEEQENLARNAEPWFDALAAKGVDFKIAVITTDVVSNGGESGYERAGVQSFTFKSTFPFVLIDFDGSNCRNTTTPHACFRGPVISSSDPRGAQIQTFRDVIRVGSCGSGNEQALKALRRALEAPCNAGFLRDDADLMLVIVSNSEDWEWEAESLGVPATPIATYVAELARKKGSAANIRVAAIVAAIDGRPSRCRVGSDGAPTTCGTACDARGVIPDGSGTSCVPGAQNPCPAGELCSFGNGCVNQDLLYWDSCWHCGFYNAPDCCSARPSQYYLDLALAIEAEALAARTDVVKTGCRPPAEPGQQVACLIESICQAEYKDTLTRIATHLTGGPASYTLDPPASEPAAVAVVASGSTLANGTGFTVSEDGRTLTLAESARPAPGSAIEVYCLRR